MFNVEHWKYLKGSVCPQRLHGWKSSPIRNNFCFIWLDLWFLIHLPDTSIRYIFLSLVAKELSTFSTHGLIFYLTWYLNVLFQPVIGAFPASPLLMIFHSVIGLVASCSASSRKHSQWPLPWHMQWLPWVLGTFSLYSLNVLMCLLYRAGGLPLRFWGALFYA